MASVLREDSQSSRPDEASAPAAGRQTGIEKNMVIDTSCRVRTNPFATLADPNRGVYRRRAAGAIHDLWRCGRLSRQAVPITAVFERHSDVQFANFGRSVDVC
jgi:hypothetical protein